MPLTCVENYKNIGESSCNKILQALEYGILVPRGANYAKASIETSAFWQTEVKKAWGSRAVVLPVAFDLEVNDTDPVFVTSALNKRKKLLNRVYNHIFLFDVGYKQKIAINSFDNTNWSFIPIDNLGQAAGVDIDATNINGFPVKIFTDERRSTGTDAATLMAMEIEFENSVQFNSQMFLFDGSAINNVFRLTTVDLAVVGTPSATEIILSVTKGNDGVVLTGLAEADFTFATAAGADQTTAVQSMVDNGDGTYTFTTTGLATGSANLVTAANLSLDAYEAAAAVDFTVT